MPKLAFTSMLVALTGILPAGCGSFGVAARINERPAVFSALNATEQAMIREGEIDVGFTTDMVYLALGKPSTIQTLESANGPLTLWVYQRYVVPQGMATVFSTGGGMNQPTTPLVGNNAPRQQATSAATVEQHGKHRPGRHGSPHPLRQVSR